MTIAGLVVPRVDQVRETYLVIRSVSEGRSVTAIDFGVREPIPAFPVPLLRGEDEPTLDLGPLLAGIYDRALADGVLRAAGRRA